MMHPLAHVVPAICCACAALYLARLIVDDLRAGVLRSHSREAAEGIAYVLAATAAAVISGLPVLAWAVAAATAL